MNLLYIIFSLSLFTSCGSSTEMLPHQLINQNPIIENSKQQALDHAAWDALLKKYVDSKGFVDYKGFKKDHTALKDYLAYLNKNAPVSATSRKEQFAYYINLYNAAAIDIILENDMPKSIKDIGGTFTSVWNIKHVKINDELYSLSYVEKEVLQEMGDPRIHFAINCASYSCPKLQNTAFTAANLNTLMDKGAREFVNSSKNDLSNSAKPQLSKIFDWYKSDFTDTGVSLIDYINKYAVQPVNQDASLSYLDYNWNLNKQ